MFADSYGQIKELHVPDSDSNFYPEYQKNIAQIKLPNLTKSKDSLHFRFSTYTQIIDIWTKDYKVFYGTFSNFTTSFTPDGWKRKKRKREAFYSDKSNLDTSIARQVFDIFNTLSILTIPTEDSIKDWMLDREYIKDGELYVIEYSSPTFYFFRTYFCPDLFKDKIKEAAKIDSLINFFKTAFQMKDSFKKFINTLPNGCYHAGSYHMLCRNEEY